MRRCPPNSFNRICSRQRSAKMGLESLRTGSLTLPDYYDTPTKPPQGPSLIPVPGHVLSKLLLPELDVALRRISILAPGMPVPETPVDEDRCLVLRQNDVRSPGQVLPMKAEAVTHPVKHGADNQFRLRVPTADARHVPAAPLLGQNVHLSHPSQPAGVRCIRQPQSALRAPVEQHCRPGCIGPSGGRRRNSCLEMSGDARLPEPSGSCTASGQGECSSGHLWTCVTLRLSKAHVPVVLETGRRRTCASGPCLH